MGVGYLMNTVPGEVTTMRPSLIQRTIVYAVLTALVGAAAASLAWAQPGGKGGKLPDSVKLIADIQYAGNTTKSQRLNLLLPKAPKGDKPLPVIVYIQGSAWMASRPAGGHAYLSKYVAGGEYVGVGIGHRTTAEATWPAQIHDVKAAIRWIRGNAKNYNIDPDRIGAIGNSSGGHLVSALGTTGGVKELEGDLGEFKGLSSRVQCVVDEFGPSDILEMQNYPSSLNHDAATSPEGKLVGGRVSEKKEVARAASPVTYAKADAPPFLILHGNKDNVVPYNQSERMYAALKKAGVECYFVTVDGGGHGGWRNPDIYKIERAFFDKVLRGVPAVISVEKLPSK
jgi:acetyl esterase/lipase